MKTKTLVIDNSLVTEVVNHYKHFGYTVKEQKPGENGIVILVLERKDGKYSKELAKLERKYRKLENLLPTLGIVFTCLGIMLIGVYIGLANNPDIKPYSFIGIIAFLISFLVGICFFVDFGVKVANREILKQDIIRKADRLLGEIKEIPVMEHIEPAEKHTGLIGKNIEKIVKRNVR